MTRKELESMEDAFLLALGSALLGLSSCTNASVFANPVEAKEVPAVKIPVYHYKNN